MHPTDLNKIIFLDIETVSRHPRFEEMDLAWQEMFQQKVSWQKPEATGWPDFYKERAAILAEFGQIICISAGYFNAGASGQEFRVKSYFGKEEPLVLKHFFEEIGRLTGALKQGVRFCGHNIREFDIPYICRRSLAHQIPIPEWLDFRNLKTWDYPLIDTLHAWRFGDYKNYTSLKLLAACLQVPSPKTDLDGSKVGQAYWEENDLHRIATYCQKDVVTCARILQCMNLQPMLTDEEVVEVETTELVSAPKN